MKDNGLSRPRVRIAAVSTAFQQMCSFVAVADTRDPDESLRELILHTLATFDTEKFASAQDVCDTLGAMFGVDAPNHQVQETLDRLVESGQVHKPLGTNYVLTPQARTRVQERIDQASQLQDRVKRSWQVEITARFSALDAEKAWVALQAYLAKAFLRHGIQAVAFLDPSVELPAEYVASLTTLLVEAVEPEFEGPQRQTAREAISGFLATAGRDPERAQYIAECADGAFNYFSLMVSPDVAMHPAVIRTLRPNSPTTPRICMQCTPRAPAS